MMLNITILSIQDIAKLFSAYFHELVDDVPMYVYEGLLSVFCIAVTLELTLRGLRQGIKKAGLILLLEYLLLIYCATVIFREPSTKRGYELPPFWSYEAILNGMMTLIPETVMNVVMFLPIGFLSALLANSVNWLKVVVIGVCLSTSIEILQLIFKKGCCEIDDVIHNAVGCLLGYGSYKLVNFCSNKIILK
jgi:glycopeptide antibiotics resistance protein